MTTQINFHMPALDAEQQHPTYQCQASVLGTPCEDTLRWEAWAQPRKSPWVPGPLWPTQVPSMYSYGIGLKGALVSFLMAPTGVVTLWIDTIDEAGNRSCSSNYIVVGY